MSSPNRHLIQLDGLRFIAVSGVLAAHWLGDIKGMSFLNSFSSFGVNLFFVLSGFLISSILISNKRKDFDYTTLWRFYARRFLRIFPLYYLVLFICLWLNIPNANHYTAWLFTYTANIPAALHRDSMGYVTHLWSLSVEEQFYIFFPFLILFIPGKWFKKILVALVAIAFIARVLVYLLISNTYISSVAAVYLTPTCLDCFAIGGLLALMKLRNKDLLLTYLNKPVLFWICLPVSFFFYYLAGKGDTLLCIFFSRLLCAVFCFWLIGRAATDEFGGAAGAFLSNKIIVYLGKISYGIYVYHFFMPYIFGYFHIKYEIFFYPVCTVALSMLSWHLFELPVNNLKRFFEYRGRSLITSNL